MSSYCQYNLASDYLSWRGYKESYERDETLTTKKVKWLYTINVANRQRARFGLRRWTHDRGSQDGSTIHPNCAHLVQDHASPRDISLAEKCYSAVVQSQQTFRWDVFIVDCRNWYFLISFPHQEDSRHLKSPLGEILSKEGLFIWRVSASSPFYERSYRNCCRGFSSAGNLSTNEIFRHRSVFLECSMFPHSSSNSREGDRVTSKGLASHRRPA